MVERHLAFVFTCLVTFSAATPAAAQQNNPFGNFGGILKQGMDLLQKNLPQQQQQQQQQQPPQQWQGQQQQQWQPPQGQQQQPQANKFQIRNVQRKLNALGYDAGPADGAFGNKTRIAIQQFQRDSRLPVTGQITPALMAALRQGGAPVRQAAPSNAPKGQAAPANAPTTVSGVPRILQHPDIKPIKLIYNNGRLFRGGKGRRAFNRYLDLALLGVTPGAFRKYPIAFAKGHLVPAAKRRYLNKGDWRGENEFDREDSENAFINKYEKIFLSATVKLPIRYYLVSNASYGKFKNGGFPVSYGGDASKALSNARPEYLPMSEEKARAFLAEGEKLFNTEARQLTVLYEFELTGVTIDEERNSRILEEQKLDKKNLSLILLSVTLYQGDIRGKEIIRKESKTTMFFKGG